MGRTTGGSRYARAGLLLGVTLSACWGQTALNYMPVTPCRLVDTRTGLGGITGPIAAGSTVTFNPVGACGVPSSAQSYSLNVAVLPTSTLGFLTVWPAGSAQPTAATLDSLDGRIKSNSAIIPAGTGGAVSMYASNGTQVVVDIYGYFVPATTTGSLAFYPLPPCRIADTRSNSGFTGYFGPPSLPANSIRGFPISGSCGVPSTAQGYSLNLTVVAQNQVGYLTAWAAGQGQPAVATLNATPPAPYVTPVVVSNAAIVVAGNGGGITGGIDVFTTNNTDLVIDINGYFAPPGPTGLSLYTVQPCRVLDTRNPDGSPPFIGELDVNISFTGCAPDLQAYLAQAYVLNATAIPSSYPPGLGFLTLWPQGTTQPNVSTLSALDGVIANDMAIVPDSSLTISAYASNSTHLVLDLFGYFAPGPPAATTSYDLYLSEPDVSVDAYGNVSAYASASTDYYSEYYYDLQLQLSVLFNAQGSSNWNTLCNSTQANNLGYVSISCYYSLGSQPGQVSALSSASLLTSYYVYQISYTCSSDCYDFDDYYGYSLLGIDGQQYPNGWIFSAPGSAAEILQAVALSASAFKTTLALGSCTDDRLFMIYQYPNPSYGVTVDKSSQGGGNPWVPNCAWFTQGAQSTYYTFQQLGNIGNQPYSWALVKRPLTLNGITFPYGLDHWTLLLKQNGWPGRGPNRAQTITSAFRPPSYDALWGIVPGGRHRFGDAVDIQNYNSQNQTLAQAEHDAKVCFAGRAAALLPGPFGGSVTSCPNQIGVDAGADWVEPTMPNLGCAYSCIHADWRNHDYNRYSQFGNP